MINRFSFACLLLTGAAVAQVTEHKTITLVTGRGELLQFTGDVKQVAASEPKIADVVVISPREVMVNAKEPGKTTVVIWEGTSPVSYNVDVLADTSEFDAFKLSLSAQCPGSHIEVTGKGDTMVLKGTVTDAKQIKLAGAMAETRAKTVVNLLTAPPGPEPRQIVLHVKFASIDLTLLKQFGINLFSRSSVLTGESTTGQFQSPRFSQLQPTGDQTVNFADLLNLFVYNPSLNMGATIQALQENDILQVLAEPNLMTVEGKTASFLAGGSFPFPVLTTTSTGGSVSPVITVQFKPFGVKLDFTPTVTESGAIHLQVSPEVSSLDYADAVTLQGFQIPALSQRRMDTEVELRDGETFAIAGLMDKQVQQTLDKLPWIGDIPIIGQLFSSRSTKKSNTELLVLITPHFVKPMTADQKVKMLDFPINFLPTSEEDQAKKDAKKKGAEFVGPRGEQDPKP